MFTISQKADTIRIKIEGRIDEHSLSSIGEHLEEVIGFRDRGSITVIAGTSNDDYSSDNIDHIIEELIPNIKRMGISNVDIE